MFLHYIQDFETRCGLNRRRDVQRLCYTSSSDLCIITSSVKVPGAFECLGLALLTTSNKLASQLELQPSPADLMKSDRCLSIHILSTLVRYPISSYHRVSNLKYTDNTHTRRLSQKISHNKSESLLFGFRRIRIKLVAAITHARHTAPVPMQKGVRREKGAHMS